MTASRAAPSSPSGRHARIDFLVTAGLALLLIGSWSAFVRYSGFNSIVVPTPMEVASTAISMRAELGRALGLTMLVGISGLVIGSLMGCVMAILGWLWKGAQGAVTSMALLVRSVPIIIFIPLFAHLLGFNLRMVIVTVSMLSFFPTFVLVSSGLNSLPPAFADVGAAWGAARTRLLLVIALPAAVPKLFTSIRLSAAKAVLAAMVAEFLTGIDGLGKLFLLARSDLQSSRAWAAAFVAAAASLVVFRTSEWMENRIGRRMGYRD